MAVLTRPTIPLRYFTNTAAALGVFLTSINIYGLYRPRWTLIQLGFLLTIAPTDRSLVEGITRMFCGTRIAVGVSMLGMWYYGNTEALGLSVLAGPVMATVDGFASRSAVGKGEWMHWGYLPVSFVVGFGLLEVF